MHTGYDDLNELMKTSQDLAFTIELLQVESASEYEHESWQLTEAEKLDSIPTLKDEGNTLYRTGNIQGALEKYRTALGYLEQLMLKEKPNDEEWTRLNQMKLPILLNFSQCKLDEKDYYAVIEHTSSVLSYEPDNIKALFRRGKAHMNVWNIEEAKSDFDKVAALDSTLLASVNSLLKQLSERVKEKDEETKNRMKGKLF
uniref:AH receptor-interacting protein n=1 Tax=Cacopsylla melanoneura TaxID=428564 RepID=A0A8D9ACC2_9HEMI